jgi:hypothetical protein
MNEDRALLAGLGSDEPYTGPKDGKEKKRRRRLTKAKWMNKHGGK